MKPKFGNTTLVGKTGETIQGLLVELSYKNNSSHKQVLKELTMAFVRN